MNLVREPSGLAYRIEDGRINWERDPVWMHSDDAIAAEASGGETRRRGTVRREAAAWLREALAKVPRPASEVIELGMKYGFTKRTIQRAFEQIGGERRKDAFDGPWLWSVSQGENVDAATYSMTLKLAPSDVLASLRQ
jgi:hypothetical protein